MRPLLASLLFISSCTGSKYKVGDCVTLFPEEPDYIVIESIDGEWYNVSFKEEVKTTVKRIDLDSLGTKVECEDLDE